MNKVIFGFTILQNLYLLYIYHKLQTLELNMKDVYEEVFGE